jgi:hypothetical protein
MHYNSHNAVYVTGIKDKLGNGKETAALVKEASLLLNPWSVAETQNVELVSCRKGKGSKAG